MTHFFRDQESFHALEANIPQLFAGKRREDHVRVWVVGCATGEEAYSIAMLLCEHAERLDAPPPIQVFATDIDDAAIHDGRDGIYPSTIEADVSLERLRQFFVNDHGRYRVRKELREKVLFAAHNLLRDAPFSRVDLISCRNLLIYLNRKAQDQVFDIFHFALRSGGMLFVGGSEAAGNVHALFSPLDGKHRIFVRRRAASDLEDADDATARAKDDIAGDDPRHARASAAIDSTLENAEDDAQSDEPPSPRKSGGQSSSANCT